MRGQLISEYMVFVGVAMLVVAIFISVGSTYAERTSQARHERSALEQLETIQSEIIAAALARDGYTRTIEIRPRNAVTVTVAINGSFVTAKTSRYEGALPIPPVDGTFSASIGSLTIRSQNGTVRI